MRAIGLVTLLALSACDLPGVEGNGVKAEESRAVAVFTEASVDEGLGLEVTAGEAGDEVTLTVVGDENLLELVETEVTGGRLAVRAKEAFTTRIGVHVKAKVPELRTLDADGGATAIARGLDRNGVFAASVDGGARLALDGDVAQLDAVAAGGGILHTRDLGAGVVRLDASGGAVADVCASERLEVRASGGARVTYSCGPDQLLPDVSGGATVEPAR